MNVFTDLEIEYLRGERRRLGRLATVGSDGVPHVAPVGWSLVPGTAGAIEISGRNFGTSKKFRDVQATGVAAIVIDDVLPPWRPRGIEIRGRAEALDDGHPRIHLYPARIVSWGLPDGLGDQAIYSARDVTEESSNA